MIRWIFLQRCKVSYAICIGQAVIYCIGHMFICELEVQGVLTFCEEHQKYIYDFPIFKKHRKNCECCPRHSLFKGQNVIVNIVVLNCQKCNQCLKCQVSAHKSLGLLFEGDENLTIFRKSKKIPNIFENLTIFRKSDIFRKSKIF